LAQTAPAQLRLIEIDPQLEDLLEQVVRGLTSPVKELPCQLFYDERGSALFEQICELPEYYLTRTETAILQRHAADLAERIGPVAAVIEYGSGSSRKTRILLDHLQRPLRYLPVDLARQPLLEAAAAIAATYPELEVLPVCADYTRPFELPALAGAPGRRLGFFPGSTIGNLHPERAAAFLRQARDQLGTAGALLVGVDLKKDARLLHAAYNDQAGVTAEFNRNILAHLNWRFGSDLRPEQFRHEARYNPTAGRIEMYLVSARPQRAELAGRAISFRAGEPVLTEVSYKYDPAEFAALAERGGFATEQVWTDPARWFSVQLLRPIPDTEAH
jgi:dimethylhistidine N-methyltransferase